MSKRSLFALISDSIYIYIYSIHNHFDVSRINTDHVLDSPSDWGCKAQHLLKSF